MGKGKGGLFLLVLLIGIGGAFGTMQWLGKRAKTRPHAPVAKPPDLDVLPSGAYAKGGRPNSEGPARVFFRDELSNFVVELDSWLRQNSSMLGVLDARKELAELRGRVVGAANKALPEESQRALAAVLDAALDAASVDDEGVDGAADAIFESTLLLNDALASDGLGFFVDTEMLTHGNGGRSILFFSFEVLRVILFRSEGLDIRTLRIRRLDPLNWRYNLLGFTSPKRRDALVLDNRIDSVVLDYLPILAESIDVDPFKLPPEDTYTPWYTETRKRAVAAIHDEFVDDGNAELVALAKLLARRVEIYQQWNELLDSRNLTIDVPDALEVTWEYRSQMAGLVTQAAMDELDDIQAKLTSPAMQAVYLRAHERYAQSVEGHEAQHRLDLSQKYRVNMPPELATMVGELPQGYRGEGDLASASLAETSAYLSMLARDTLTPRTNLTHLLKFLIAKRAWGMPESYAALVIFDGMATELEIAHDPLKIGRSINRAAAAEVYRALCEVEPDALHEAAERLWKRFIGRALPTLETIAR